MTLKLSVLLVAWHCLVPAFSQTLHPARVTVTASVIHADSTTPRTMVFNFLNPFIRVRKSETFNQNNTLSSSEEMVFKQNMTILYNNMFINLLVSPGDSVHLSIDAARLKEPSFKWLSISGDHAAASTQINQWHHYFNTHFNKTFMPAGSLTDMKDSVRLAFRQCIITLDSYSKANSLLPEARQWIINDLKYTVSYWASDYLVSKDSRNNQIILNHALYADPLFDQYDPKGFQSMMFPYHLGNYVYTLLKKDPAIQFLQQQMKYKDAAEHALNLINTEPKSLVRDYMLFSIINGYLSKSPLLLDSLKDLSTYFSDTLVYRYLVKASDAIRNPAVAEKPIDGLLYMAGNKITRIPPTEMLRYFGKRYPGKAIYIDIYATWCVPCLQEMEYMPGLEKKVDTSKIAFINLCLRSDSDAWQALVKKKELHGENYFLEEDASSVFMGMYRIEGFPSYFLLDRNGILKTDKAPRPSDGELLTRALKKLLLP